MQKIFRLTCSTNEIIQSNRLHPKAYHRGLQRRKMHIHWIQVEPKMKAFINSCRLFLYETFSWNLRFLSDLQLASHNNFNNLGLRCIISYQLQKFLLQIIIVLVSNEIETLLSLHVRTKAEKKITVHVYYCIGFNYQIEINLLEEII